MRRYLPSLYPLCVVPYPLVELQYLPKAIFVMDSNSDHPPARSPASTNTVPDPPPNTPYVPSTEEARFRYHGLPSRPPFVARSSCDIWTMPSGVPEYLPCMEAYPTGKHPLCDIWKGQVDDAMDAFLMQSKVDYSSIDLVRMKEVNESAGPMIVWVGVVPDSLSAERGIKVAVGLRAILLEHGIQDVHVEIRESEVKNLAEMYGHDPSTYPEVPFKEPFTPTLGITICAEDTPDIQGTATLFFTTPSKPGKLFLLAAKHVLFRVDEENGDYVYHPPAPRRNVLLLGTNGFSKAIESINDEIKAIQSLIDDFTALLAHAAARDDREVGRREQARFQPLLDNQMAAIGPLRQFLARIESDWEDPKKRIIGHVVRSPPLSLSDKKDCYTADFAVIEVDTAKINASNFAENAMDLRGTKVSRSDLGKWIPGFNHPPNRLLKFHGTLSDDEMSHPSPQNVDIRGDPTIMVLKRGHTSGLTVGCLNTVTSIVRKPFKSQPGAKSREVLVLPRKSRSDPFSEGGDSGAAVVNRDGAVAGMITSGGGYDNISDCTYVTSINFLLRRLEELGYPANIFPTAADIF